MLDERSGRRGRGNLFGKGSTHVSSNSSHHIITLSTRPLTTIMISRPLMFYARPSLRAKDAKILLGFSRERQYCGDVVLLENLLISIFIQMF